MHVPEAEETCVIKFPERIHPGFYSTGTLASIEQALCVNENGKVAVIVDCSHPLAGNILPAANGVGRVSALIGGFHGWKAIRQLEPLDLICATHCSKYKREIRYRYPEKYIRGGVGQVIQI